ncbi:metallophosphoesterase family protein [Phycisphaera mikurensis]|uniref:Calcineurin-like phosphoesterase domain-containing protein n=1 Tax=Phycisphaera mikurensis (strain NBRC 102666 / KCTC 22515 / FYK2301M01) TaxID=1142394 RepID=I0IDD9_PHYMF|nr:metallophosphoesterase family protein [Phycisphaera mikurensis]MBB6443337.1 hypothetical protein [Phycisphaera mikurensis]BAM03277.1 hypothetical protein PSMK_11180 [Phycisphaera mikurensis NBRC 102666]
MPAFGLLSDSHGRATTTERAVQVLVDAGADTLLHLGDVGTVEVIDALVAEGEDGEELPAHVVFGNTDWDEGALARYAEDLGVVVDHPEGVIQLPGGGELRFQHGHEAPRMGAAMGGGARYLCHGHSHAQRDERVGSTRVVNPGALFRASVYSVAVLDTDADTVRFLEV